MISLINQQNKEITQLTIIPFKMEQMKIIQMQMTELLLSTEEPRPEEQMQLRLQSQNLQINIQSIKTWWLTSMDLL